MTRSAAFFLILLRLAIGWHFLVEGFQKIPSEQLTALGLPTNNKPFSSAGYFREAPGPLGDAVRNYAGDPDQEALSRLTLEAIPTGRDPATYGPALRVPKGLKADWDAYLKQFAAHYGLDEQQKKAAEAALDQAAAKAVAMLTYAPDPDPAKRDKDPNHAEFTSEQTRTYVSGDVKRRMTVAERVAEYRQKLDDLSESSGKKLWLFGKDVEGARLRTAKAEVASLRAGLLADLDKQTQAYKDAVAKTLTDEQQKKEVPKPEKEKTLVGYLDVATPWMLTGVGAFLLLGLFSRLGAFVGAGFLLMTYLAVPAWPWLPAAGPTEGNYLFVNKNLVEMLALCVLMCVPTGRWFGLDAILHVFGRLFFGDKTKA